MGNSQVLELERDNKIWTTFGTANIGLKLGQDKLRTQAQRFGFNARHLSDLSGVASRFPDNLDPAQLALSSIGQFDVAASPLSPEHLEQATLEALERGLVRPDQLREALASVSEQVLARFAAIEGIHAL